jgi:hypothetical protein
MIPGHSDLISVKTNPEFSELPCAVGGSWRTEGMGRNGKDNIKRIVASAPRISKDRHGGLLGSCKHRTMLSFNAAMTHCYANNWSLTSVNCGLALGISRDLGRRTRPTDVPRILQVKRHCLPDCYY